MSNAEKEIAASIFKISPRIRYVAIRSGDRLHLEEREGLSGASSSESDRYEELLVNPTLLTLTRQRGDIDCGGLDFVLVGYGNFRQLVIPTASGHVSVALEVDAVSIEAFEQIVGSIEAALGEISGSPRLTDQAVARPRR